MKTAERISIFVLIFAALAVFAYALDLGNLQVADEATSQGSGFINHISGFLKIISVPLGFVLKFLVDGNPIGIIICLIISAFGLYVGRNLWSKLAFAAGPFVTLISLNYFMRIENAGEKISGTLVFTRTMEVAALLIAIYGIMHISRIAGAKFDEKLPEDEILKKEAAKKLRNKILTEHIGERFLHYKGSIVWIFILVSVYNLLLQSNEFGVILKAIGNFFTGLANTVLPAFILTYFTVFVIPAMFAQKTKAAVATKPGAEKKAEDEYSILEIFPFYHKIKKIFSYLFIHKHIHGKIKERIMRKREILDSLAHLRKIEESWRAEATTAKIALLGLHAAETQEWRKKPEKRPDYIALRREVTEALIVFYQTETTNEKEIAEAVHEAEEAVMLLAKNKIKLFGGGA